MIEIDWSRSPIPPRDHQKVGVITLLKNPIFMLADDVGAGKSKQIIDACQLLFEDGQIDTAVVLTPAFARGVWADPDPALGEVAKHSWPSIPYEIREYSVSTAANPEKTKRLLRAPSEPRLQWIVTNYEFIRKADRLAPLLAYLATRKFVLNCDEAWNLKSQKTAQFESAYEIRRIAQRVWLLNGTPIADSPMDLNAQMRMLSPKILGFNAVNKRGQPFLSNADSRFRSRYALLKPNVTFPQIVGYQNLEELREKVAPYVLRRMTRDCFDLPEILEPITLEAKLDPDNWSIYKQMRENMVAWLGEVDGQNVTSVAKQAIVRSMRLAQITSGFIGGIQLIDLDADLFSDDEASKDLLAGLGPAEVRVIGSEKIDTFTGWLGRLGSEDPERLLVWCKFRLEVERAAAAIQQATGRRMLLLYGQQSKADREAAVAALNPDIPVSGRVGVVGNPSAGGAALNLSGASVAADLSLDSKLRVYLQARGRIDRPGQRNKIRYVNVVATGPKGQKTIDHHVLAALRGKQDIATWTTATWRRALTEE